MMISNPIKSFDTRKADTVAGGWKRGGVGVNVAAT